MTITALVPEQVHPRISEFVVVDVRTPGEYASGHLPGAYNIPLDRLDRAAEALKSASKRGQLLVVCASGARSGQACELLAGCGIEAANLTGGTQAWIERGHNVRRVGGKRAVWPMDRQVRFTAGSLVLAGLLLGRKAPKLRLLSAGIATGLIYSGVSGTCGMAAVLSKLPFNQADESDLEETIAALAG